MRKEDIEVAVLTRVIDELRALKMQKRITHAVKCRLAVLEAELGKAAALVAARRFERHTRYLQQAKEDAERQEARERLE